MLAEGTGVGAAEASAEFDLPLSLPLESSLPLSPLEGVDAAVSWTLDGASAMVTSDAE